jgi:hypothetical protein
VLVINPPDPIRKIVDCLGRDQEKRLRADSIKLAQEFAAFIMIISGSVLRTADKC